VPRVRTGASSTTGWDTAPKTTGVSGAAGASGGPTAAAMTDLRPSFRIEVASSSGVRHGLWAGDASVRLASGDPSQYARIPPTAQR
jgi:hypothetical protein